MADDLAHHPVPPHVRDAMSRVVRGLPADGDVRFRVRLAIRRAYAAGYDDGMRDGAREARDDMFDEQEAVRLAAADKETDRG